MDEHLKSKNFWRPVGLFVHLLQLLCTFELRSKVNVFYKKKQYVIYNLCWKFTLANFKRHFLCFINCFFLFCTSSFELYVPLLIHIFICMLCNYWAFSCSEHFEAGITIFDKAFANLALFGHKNGSLLWFNNTSKQIFPTMWQRDKCLIYQTSSLQWGWCRLHVR